MALDCNPEALAHLLTPILPYLCMTCVEWHWGQIWHFWHFWHKWRIWHALYVIARYVKIESKSKKILFTWNISNIHVHVHVKQRIFLVTQNLFPVTGIKKNLSCHKALFLWKKEYFLSLKINFLSHEEQKHLVSQEAYFIAQKIYFLWPAKKFILLSNKFRYFRYFLWQKNTLWFDLFHPLFERDGAICKLIPRLWISDLFVIGYNFALIIVWMMMQFFPRCFGRNYLLET